MPSNLCLQIEHHLFPAISFVHYPAIARIVAEECQMIGVRYVHHGSLFSILSKFVQCVKQLGSAPDAAAPAAVGAAPGEAAAAAANKLKAQ